MLKVPAEKGFRHQIKELLIMYKPDIVFWGNKNYFIRPWRVIHTFKIPNLLISPNGFSRDRWLLWVNMMNFQRDIIHASNRSIHCRITDIEKYVSWLGTFLYGCPQHYLKTSMETYF